MFTGISHLYLGSALKKLGPTSFLVTLKIAVVSGIKTLELAPLEVELNYLPGSRL